jgi:hypothetical protein
MGMSRRRFLAGSAVVGGTAWTLATAPAGAVNQILGPPTPRPIPGGLNLADFGGPDLLLHVFPPAPGFELATITDFNGAVGAAEIRGLGTDSDGATRAFDVDMRFLQGEFVGEGGRHATAAFGFI